MAETWGDYFLGSEDQRLQAMQRQREAYAQAKAHPAYDRARIMAHRGATMGDYGEVDPRALMMTMVADGLYPPAVAPEAYEDAGYAADFAWNLGGRPRDTAFRAMQEAAKGNFVGSAALAGQAVASPVAPSMAAGGHGQPDDWRKFTTPGMAMFLDVATDPMTYGTLGIKPAARAGGGLLRSLLNAADEARYGRGAPAFLEDSAGNAIRRLQNAPGGVAGPLLLR
jgi:hypothetical protein